MKLKKNNKILYNKFLGILIKKGKKNQALTILNKALTNIARKSNQSSNYIMLKLFLKLNTNVEVKTFKFRKKTFSIPFPLKFNRKIFLPFKWLYKACLLNTKKTNFSKKLSIEMFNTIFIKKSLTLNFKKENIIKAKNNRANLHYRWY